MTMTLPLPSEAISLRETSVLLRISEGHQRDSLPDATGLTEIEILEAVLRLSTMGLVDFGPAHERLRARVLVVSIDPDSLGRVDGYDLAGVFPCSEPCCAPA